jgi:hypothetical protein
MSNDIRITNNDITNSIDTRASSMYNNYILGEFTGSNTIYSSNTMDGFMLYSSDIPVNRTSFLQYRSPNPELESAYDGLLGDRQKNIFAVNTDGIISEDDTICDINLRTATLFLEWNEQYKRICKELTVLNEDNKEIELLTQKLKGMGSQFKHLNILYDKDSSDSIHKQFSELETATLACKKRMYEDIEKQHDDVL